MRADIAYAPEPPDPTVRLDRGQPRRTARRPLLTINVVNAPVLGAEPHCIAASVWGDTRRAIGKIAEAVRFAAYVGGAVEIMTTWAVVPVPESISPVPVTNAPPREVGG